MDIRRMGKKSEKVIRYFLSHGLPNDFIVFQQNVVSDHQLILPIF